MKQNRILVLGATGMLGHKVYQVLSERYPDTLAVVKEDLSAPPFNRISFFRKSGVYQGKDAMDLSSLKKLLCDLKPQYILNCIGIIKQREEAKAAIPSITLNSLLPHLLCRWAADWGGRVIHFSTDCVFSGRKGNYQEDEPSDAEDLYGRTKYLGEVAYENALTLRTSIIGRELMEHRSLLDWFLSQQGKSVLGYSRAIFSGVTTVYLANMLPQILERQPFLSGLFHLASEPIAKYDLLLLIKEAYKLNVVITKDETVVIDRSLNGQRFSSYAGIQVPSWPTLIMELRGDPSPYEKWLGV